MRITIIAHRFEGGAWKPWEHVCDADEIAAVLDSANAKAFDRALSPVLVDSDYLEGARYIFDRAYGTAERPCEGDLRITKVIVSIVAQTEAEDFKKSA